MKVLFDTNIWIDIILKRKGFWADSECTYFGCLYDNDTVLVAATSLKDIYYITSKYSNKEIALDAIEKILNIVEVCAVDKIICEHALRLDEPDFEDGIIAACAIAENVDVIISRDVKAFKDVEIPCYTSKEFVKMQGWSEIDFNVD